MCDKRARKLNKSFVWFVRCLTVSLAASLILITAVCALRKDPLEEKLVSMGYNIKERSSGLDIWEKWERKHFDLQSKHELQIESVKPMQGKDDTYYRFTVWEEVYADETKATARLQRLKEVPTDAPAEDKYYFIVEGFQNKANVYIVKTDAILFMDELGRFTKRLEKAIKEQQ